MFEKYNRLSEIFWLIATLSTLVMVIYLIWAEGFEKNKWYVLIPFLASAMYLMRRAVRKKFEKNTPDK
jgi:NADH:ubiquinone oxidoreductase subunit 2 (subunit N)